jgi:hypothetical protein
MSAQQQSICGDRPNRRMTQLALQAENASFRGTGGISEENRCLGFQPAFFDSRSGTIHPSRFADGRPAPIHVLDGLPDELVVERSALGRVSAVESCVIAGFVLDGRFYTREAAAKRAAERS